MKFLIKALASGFGAGLSPVAPGTAGSALAVGIALCLRPWWNPQLALALTLVVSLAGVYCAGRAEEYWGHDSHKIVIDEVAGMFLALALTRLSWTGVAAAFFLFRLLDIVKPPPARQAERLPGGWGVMADDLVAGAYALALLWGLSAWM